MNPNDRYRLIWTDGYEIDYFGRVFRVGQDRKPLDALSRRVACNVWNHHAWSRHYKGPFLEGIGTYRSRGGHARVDPERLVHDGRVAWLYLSSEHREAIQQGDFPIATMFPDEWIPMNGDCDNGWVMITSPRFHTLFHGPSVAVWTIDRTDGPHQTGRTST